MKIVFMGTPEFAETILEGLTESRHEVVLCITQPDKQKGRGKKLAFPPVKELALRHGIRVLQPERIKDDPNIASELMRLKPDISVVAAYGQIIPPEILDQPKFGSVNVHASLLPQLRGASPIQHAILQGKKKTGVTIMQMNEGLDTGDMISKAEIEIGELNFSELHDKLAVMGRDLLLKTLDEIESGRAVRLKQDEALSSYAPLIRKKDGHLDFTKSPCELVNQIKAFDPWPGAFAIYNEKGDAMKFLNAEASDIRYEKAEPGSVTAVDSDSFTVSCAGGSLIVREIQVPGKKRLMVGDYLRGNSLEKGSTFR